ncbi:hypothetical protein PCANC_06851 [Puccinia coronata f. sp. avenae]|uniref:DHHA2 domain-containing protein n=1 Tax=Puccinia coronata f. sp. avenae TaxID=200324 RepID=A0A2N5VVH7_9BASI|nr:hypothetical protein PCANC_06851 [Puccinia coronata f. sp. avenae]
MAAALVLTALRHWLIKQQQAFIADFAAGSLKNWVLCVGNEAGDLDTLASSIGFSFFATLTSAVNASYKEQHRNYIPVQQTKSTDFTLRAENIQVLKLANLVDEHQEDLPLRELICADQLDFTKFTPYGAQYALVDHNRINSALFGDSAHVVAVIDHHQAEANDTLYLSATPRVIQVPTGSCASLVTNYFASDLASHSIPPEMADMLLSAIALDTGNFKLIAEDGKATESDLAAKQWLVPRSRFGLETTSVSLSGTSTGSLKDYSKQLAKIQKDVSKLSSAQLLLRDFKQSDMQGWSLGISSVPTPLEAWVREKCAGDWSQFLDALKQHADEKKLGLACILTSAFKPKNLVAAGADAPPPGRRLVLLASGAHQDLISTLITQEQQTFTSDPSLQLSPLTLNDPTTLDIWTTQHHASCYMFIVGNPSVSRKQVTPFLLKLMEKLGPKP